jgi:hypothetical protein
MIGGRLARLRHDLGKRLAITVFLGYPEGKKGTLFFPFTLSV